MRALAVKQPWAFLIVNGYKPVENRSRRTHMRGRIAIHASQSFDQEGYDFVRENFPEIEMPEKDGFDFGGIVGGVDLVDSVTNHDSPFYFGPHGWVVENPKPCKFHRCLGRLSFFNIGEVEV